MNDIFLSNGIELNGEKLEKFSCFYNFLTQENEKYNLTAIKSESGVYLKHFADSLWGAEFFADNACVLEVGSGAGFPSVPLKINNESLNFTLIEATGKKCAFLRASGEKLGFKNFYVLQGRAEVLAKNQNYREKFDIVTARAVAQLNELLEFTVPFLKVGGNLVLYKNYSLSEINEAKSALKTLNCEIKQIKKYVLSGETEEKVNSDKSAENGEKINERAIIVIEKKAKTPEKYPREYKQIIKKPL